MKDLLIEKLNMIDNENIEFGEILKEAAIEEIEAMIEDNREFKEKVEVFISDKYLAESLIGKEKTKKLKSIILEEDFGSKKLNTNQEIIKFINESSVKNIVNAVKNNFLFRKKVEKLLKHQNVAKKVIDENKLISLSSQLANEVLFSEDNEEKFNVTLGLNSKNSKVDFPSLLKDLPVNKTIKLLKENQEFKNEVVKFFDNYNADDILGKEKSLLIKAEIGREIGINSLWEGDYRRYAENALLMEKYFPEQIEERSGFGKISKAREKKIRKIVRTFPKASIEDIINKIPNNWLDYSEDLERRADEIIQDEKKKMKDEGIDVNLNYDRPMKVNEEEKFYEPKDLVLEEYFGKTGDLDPLSVFGVNKHK